MGLTAVALIYSPWGQRSGAHMNPAVTLTFLMLGKIHVWDAVCYCIAQLIGGLAGVYCTTKVTSRHQGITRSIASRNTRLQVFFGVRSKPDWPKICCFMRLFSDAVDNFGRLMQVFPRSHQIVIYAC